MTLLCDSFVNKAEVTFYDVRMARKVRSVCLDDSRVGRYTMDLISQVSVVQN